MKRIILMSIRPEWYGLIEELKKTYEVRKDPLPEGAVVYIYLTKRWHKVLEKLFPKLNGKLGKVVAKFIVGKVEKLFLLSYAYAKDDKEPYGELVDDILKKACLDYDGWTKYALKKDHTFTNPLYALSITQLEIFDKPRELGEYYTFKKKTVYSGMDCPPYVDEVKCPITRAPQSYCHAWIEE